MTPLKLERHQFLTRRLNAYFTHGEADYFLARRDGRVVGRITAQIDFAYNRFHGTRTGMFGFLEFEDDPEVLAALVRTAEWWLRARGCDVGPSARAPSWFESWVTGAATAAGAAVAGRAAAHSRAATLEISNLRMGTILLLALYSRAAAPPWPAGS